MEAAARGIPFRYVGVNGGHGFITLLADGTYRLEHCQDGRWGECDLGPQTGERQARKAAMRHLARRPHRFEGPQQLAGLCHAGGGNGIKGPR